MAVGDVILDRDEPESAFVSTGAVLGSADITFGNLELPYAESAPVNPMVKSFLLGDPRNVPGLAAVGFDVMSFANNHHMDRGYEAFARTLELLEENGIACCGAGRNIEKARRPAIVERGGAKVAFLAYASVMPIGYEADADKPGGAPLRVLTSYYPFEEIEWGFPGTPPVVHTFADPADLAAMQEDVRRAKESADLVVFTCHWGLHYVRAAVADYEGQMARAAIDAGADIVLGHHQHILKGIDSYRGKLIVHSLSHFVMDIPLLTGDEFPSPRMKALMARYPEQYRFDPEYPSYPFSADTRMTVMVKLHVRDASIETVELLPCVIQSDNSSRLVDPGEDLFGEIVEYIATVGAESGMSAALDIRDSRVIVTPSEVA